MARPVMKAFSDMPLPGDDVFESIEDLVVVLERTSKLLGDASVSSMRLVLNPEKMVIKEALRAETYLTLYGYPIDSVLCNRILPGVEGNGLGDSWVKSPSSDPYLHHLQEIQARYLATIERDFYPLPILRSGWFDTLWE